VDARKVRFDAQEAWCLLENAPEIVTAKGKKINHLKPGEDEKDLVLKNVMGPSGNLRAPTYRYNQKYVIGFNEELYKEWLAKEEG